MEIDKLNSTTSTSQTSIDETRHTKPKKISTFCITKESTKLMLSIYITKINSYNCEYFNVNTYNEVAHSAINIKQLLNKRLKIKEHSMTESINKQKIKI